MNKVLAFQAVIHLINDSNYGYYALYSLIGGELLGGSHITNDEIDKPMSTTELVDNLRTKIEFLGYGQYKILLKKAPKTPNSSAVTMRFEVKPDAHELPQPQSTQNSFSGMGMSIDQIDRRVTESIAQAIARENEKFLQEKKIMLLEMEIQRMKENKKTSNDSPAWAESLGTAMKMIGGILVAKFAPESVPMINAMMTGTTQGDEDNETQVFTRND